MPKTHILLVDDEVDFAEILTIRLQMRGYEVSTVHNGEDALKKAKERPDIILLDVMMPKMSGYEVCRRLRQDSITRNIPIMMLTAKKMTQDKVEGLQIGADDYLTKSADMEELFARIEALLRRKELAEGANDEKANLVSELRKIIEDQAVDIVFQPIYRLEPRKLIGHEVLTRISPASPLKNPDMLFKCALRYGMLVDLEMVCRRKALAVIGDAINSQLFFFNTSPYIVESEKFREILTLYRHPEQVVLEMTERAEIKDFTSFYETLRSFRQRGFKMAIDDVGSGYSSLDAIAELEPNFVKIDIGLVRDVDTNPKKQNLVKAIIVLCKGSTLVSVGEGIETEGELNTLIELGVEAGQGYLFGRPSAEIKRE